MKQVADIPHHPRGYDFKSIQKSIIGMLHEGAFKAQSPFNRLSLATVGLDGKSAKNRIVILRSVEDQPLSLIMHSDYRRDKIREMVKNPDVSLLFYCPQTEQQLRIDGSAKIHHNCAYSLTQWEQATSYNKRMYLAISPGDASSEAVSSLSEAALEMTPDHDNTMAGYENFSVVKVTVRSIDWLQLNKTGNIQARFTPSEIVEANGEQIRWQGEWVYP